MLYHISEKPKGTLSTYQVLLGLLVRNMQSLTWPRREQ
ncbi:unnamed protein product [Ranitomeya imitator]|uniref:Uncharacterized protein n=1 Tax=Ranitomeya imitator TaxID=111125 RepID=A0ABN9LKB1_9NEOB|nr:unnamed protein product [Ranitomeya imitator]